MPREGAAVELLDGVPHVRVTRLLWSEPTVLVLWYPVAPACRADATALVGVELDADRSGSRFRVSATVDPVLWRRWQGTELALASGAQTEPARALETPMPRPPRVRAELKWEHGAWHKLTARGWAAV